MVVFDATFVMLLVDPDAAVPNDPATGRSFSNPRARIEHLLNELNKSGESVLIPTPALSEVLVGARGATADLVAELSSGYRLRMAPFDELAAIEVALITENDAAGKSRLDNETKAKVKYDRQIIGIAKATQADAVYTDDEGLRSKAEASGIRVVGLADLDLPQEEIQSALDLSDPSDDEPAI